MHPYDESVSTTEALGESGEHDTKALSHTASPSEPQGDALTVQRRANAKRFASRRRLMGVGAMALLTGLGLVATGDRDGGPWLTVGAFVVCVAVAHSLGRLGPDPGAMR